MLVWFAWLWFNPGPAPYRYQLVEEGGVDKFGQLGLEAWPDLTIAKYEVRAEDIDKPLASAILPGAARLRPSCSWENRTSELIVSVDSKLNELTALASAINKYAGKDALILAWWDTSRQIKLLAARDTLFNSHWANP